MKILNPQEAAKVETFFSPSSLKPKLEALETGQALLIKKTEWEYKSPPRTLVHDLMGAGKFSVKLTKDKKAWLVTKL